MGMNKPDTHPELQLRRTSGIFDHFNSYTDAQLWTKGGSGTGVTNPDADGGVARFTTGAVQDQDATLRTTRKLFTFVAGKPLIFQCGLKYTEGNTNKCGIAVGFMEAVAAILTDTTYALPASLSCAIIFKKPGDILWSCFSSILGVQQVTQSNVSCIQPAITQELIVNVMVQGSNIEVTFWGGGSGPSGNGQLPFLPNVTNMGRMQPIKHTIPIVGPVAMYAAASLKAGSGTTEVMDVDYIGTEQLSIP